MTAAGGPSIGPVDDTAAITDLAALAAELGTSQRRLRSLISNDVPGAVYIPERRGWYLSDDVVEQLRRRTTAE